MTAGTEPVGAASAPTPVTAVTRPAVVLIGAPGAGKTTVARALSRILGLTVRDTDHDIEVATGRSIPDIFVTDGEPAFRALERAAVATALAEHTGIVSLGGGAPLDETTRVLLRGHATVHLRVSMPQGVRRTGLATNRPMLTGINPRATYKALLEARLPVYREVSAFEVDTDDLTIEQVGQRIAAWVRSR